MLQLAALRRWVHEVHFIIEVRDSLLLTFIYDGDSWVAGNAWNIALHTLQNRVESYGGTITAEEDVLGQRIHIELPLKLRILQ